NHSPLVAQASERVDIVRQIDAAAEAGFASVELDVFSLRAWRDNGGSLRDVVLRLDDQGLSCYALAGLHGYDDHARSVAEGRAPRRASRVHPTRRRARPVRRRATRHLASASPPR